MVVRSRFPAWLLIALLLGSCALPGPSARAQNNSLFPKGGPNRQLPHATPLPRGASAGASSAAGSSSRRRPAPPPRPDTVALPYNLVWFDTQNKLASLFAGVSAQIAEKKTVGPNEIWSVKGLIAPNLQTSFFTFQQGMLIALEFDYGQENWDEEKYREVMGQFRRLVEAKCLTPGEIISRKTDQPPDSTVKQTLMGYQWVRGDTEVQLFYYSAEDTSKSLTFRSISVHYRYHDPNALPPGQEPPPPAPSAPGGGNQTVSVTPQGPQGDNAPGGALPMPDNAPGGALPLPDNAAAAGTGPAPAASPTPSPKTNSKNRPKGSPTPTPTPTPVPSPAASPSASLTVSPAPAASVAPGASPTPGASPSPGPVASPAVNPTPVASPAASAGPTPAVSPAVSPGPAGSPGADASPAASPDAGPMPSVSPDASPAATASPTPSVTPSPTPKPTPTPTPKRKKKR